MSLTRDHLVSQTSKFFSLHWPRSAPQPVWSEPEWMGVGSVPNFDLQGCYALTRGDYICYIGSAVGRGSALRRRFGISKRIASRYVRRDRTTTRLDGLPVFTFLNDYTGAFTIGFRDFAYLAIALEHYLIGCFDSLDNKIKLTPNTLTEIERHFHDAIRGVAGDLLRDSPNLELPSIDDAVPTSEDSAAWFEVPGMYGGFSYWIDSTREVPTLIAESWSRVCEGSGERREITPDGSVLVDQGFV